jgi:tRNA nucleotidyltransferase/poly(A) polymerase
VNNFVLLPSKLLTNPEENLPVAMTPREFALNITRKLQTAGYQALWAGGCVRDQLLGRQPKDYDIATNARPEQVRKLFGHQRTLAIGASFGVITVLGPKSAGPIEVATFRRDAGYSDGRRPDSVEFTDAREDARRRDFTINGVFFDPVTGEYQDYVGGRDDLQNKIVRAIGNPHERIDEDKLRMLRAIRFAATFEFELDPDTLAAIQQHAREIKIVSGERIGAEMRRMLAHPRRATAARLLRESGLLAQILIDGEQIYESEQKWNLILQALERLSCHDFVCGCAILVSHWQQSQTMGTLAGQWKLSNDEKNSIGWILEHLGTFVIADRLPWSAIQPLLIHPDAQRCIDVEEALIFATRSIHGLGGLGFCRERMSWPIEKLNPPPFINGNDLKQLGVKDGRRFGRILQAIRDEQLDEKIKTRDEAIQRVGTLVATM